MEVREVTERYDLEKILRSGRAATLMRASDRSSGRAVVMKLIQPASPDGLAEAAGRFQAYAAALAAVRHPALPAVLDSGVTSDGSAFLVLEPLEGRGLDALAGKLPPAAALRLLGQVLDGLEALAGRGLAHGNLAADNVLALPGPDGGRVKLLGLGSPVFRGSSRPDLPAFARTACQLLGAAAAPGDAPAVQLPFAVTLELADDAALRSILERLLSSGPAPGFEEIRAAFRRAAGEAGPAKAAAPPPPAPAAPEPAPASVPAPASAPALPATVPPEPEREPAFSLPEGDALPAITDEMLDALAVPPPPPPVPVERAPEMAPAAARPRRTLAAAAVAALAVLVLGAGAWWLLRPAEEAAAPLAAPAAPVPPPRPATEDMVLRLEQARLLLAQGEDARAAEVVRSLGPSGQSALPPDACARLADLEGMLALLAAERLPADLARGLESGDLALLRSVVATGAELGGVPAELEEGFERARRLVELHRLAEADAAEGRHAAVLERLAEVEELAPGAVDPLDLRGKAAAALEGEAEALARQARYEEALAHLAPLQRTWASREGLEARAAAYARAREDEPKQKALLDSIPAWERRKQPHEALALLAAEEPIPHLRPRFEEARKLLQAQLGQLDQAPPQIALRDGYSLEYSRGGVAELSFRVTDDYLVRDVKLMVRPPGGKMRELPLQHSRAGGSWSAEIPLSLHQNGTLELYVVATDLSGHEGFFGTPGEPKKLTRTGSNRL